MYNIYDAHCHIYPEAISLKAVAAVDTFYDHLPAEHYDGTTATLVRSGAMAGITHYLVHSVATRPHQVSSINRFIAAEVAASQGAFTGLGTMHLDSEDLRRDFEELRTLGLRGVKLHPDIQRFEADAPRAMEIYGMCEDAGLPVLVHTGDYRYDYSNPRRIARILRAFPRLQFVGAHFGGWSVWDEAARVLSDFDNISVDCSSTFYAVTPGKARELVRAWTPDRVMFGTDYPLWPQQRDVDALLAMDLDDADYRKIFWENAERVYGI